jgi:hypothetical protein
VKVRTERGEARDYNPSYDASAAAKVVESICVERRVDSGSEVPSSCSGGQVVAGMCYPMGYAGGRIGRDERKQETLHLMALNILFFARYDGKGNKSIREFSDPKRI